MMAFIQLEDLLGTVEVIIFPNDYEKYQAELTEEAKLYIKGRVSASEDQQAKLIAEKIIPFDKVPKEVWLQYPDKNSFIGQQEACTKPWRGIRAMTGSSYSVKWKKPLRNCLYHGI